MKKSYIKILVLLLVFILLLVGCSQDTANDGAVEESEELILTSQELSEFDGKDGNAAYIAVDDIIYDVSDIAPWDGGAHNGFEAGLDLTEEIKNMSPHGVSKLDDVPIVGKLQD